jgi:hypothetical protein
MQAGERKLATIPFAGLAWHAGETRRLRAAPA